MSKQDKFILMVNTMLPVMVQHKEEDIRRPEIVMRMSDTLGKANKVTLRELEHPLVPISEKVMQFINYQMYWISNRPHWYEGASIKR